VPASATRLTLVVPGFAPGTDSPDATDLCAPLRALLARADWQAGTSSTAGMLATLGYAPDCAHAPLMAAFDLDLTETTHWLRADPVHLRADAKLVMLVAPARGDVSLDEATALLAALNTAMPEIEWRCGRAPDRWYARVTYAGATPPLGPAWLNGRSLTPFFPLGAAHRRWRQLTNEAQMVLHAAAANARREAQRLTPLNAVWLWGGGSAPQATHSAVTRTFGNDVLLAGAARVAGIAWQPDIDANAIAQTPAGASVLVLCGAPFGEAGPAGNAGVVADANRAAALVWPLLNAGQLGAIDILGEGLRGVATLRTRYRVWRRRLPGAFGDPHAVVST